MTPFPSSWIDNPLSERIIQESGDGIFVFDRDQRYLVWSPAMERLFGLRSDRAIGRRTSDVFPFLAKSGQDRHHAAALAGEEVTVNCQPFRMPETGRTGAVHVRLIPLTNRYGCVVAVLGIVRDTVREGYGRGEPRANVESSKVGERIADTGEPRSRTARVSTAVHDTPGSSSISQDALATTAHELRTPVNAIIGYVELLAGEIAGPLTAEQREQLDRVATSARHLLCVSKRILEHAKLEAHAGTENALIRHSVRQRHRASCAVSTAITLVHPQATARGVTLSVGVDKTTDAWYYGDAESVTQILVNLLSNAVKFTPAGGRVVVFAGETTQRDGAMPGRWTYLRVDDTGVGIAPERLAAVFAPFVHSDPERPEHGPADEGVGLGLAISRQLARQMGGDVTAASVPNVGSRFTLWLPAGRP